MNESTSYRKKFVVEEESVLIPKISLNDIADGNGNKVDRNSTSDYSRNIWKRLSGISLFKANFMKNLKKEDLAVENRPRGKVFKITLSLMFLILAVLLIQGLMIFRVYQEGIALKSSAEKFVASAKSKDLELIKNENSALKLQLNSFNKSYKNISWFGVFPFVGKFVDDGQHAINAGFYGLDLVDTLLGVAEPYADIMGFNNASGTFQANETAQDKLDFLVKTLPDLVPKADGISQKMDLIKKEIDEIDPNDYPIEFASYRLRENVEKIVDMTDLSADMAKNAKPLLESAPYLMGVDGERTYLVIFQNDKELRPTGGFITAYSIAKVVNGKFEPTSSDDIYNLDNNYKPTIAAPQPIIDHIEFPYSLSKYLRLRDMNWSPDFSVSMDMFLKEVKKAGIPDVDGIIAVDTQVLVNLLDVIGPVNVPGYGEYSNKIVDECNCPQVIYELESFADIEGPIVWSENEPGKIVYAPENYDNRKKIIGPLMNSILSSILGQPNEKMPSLFEAAIKSLSEKHALFYLNEEKAQKAIENFGIGGVIVDSESDYLHINDANLGGRKSNLYVTQEVLQNVEIAEDGSVTKTLTITYKNPEKHDGWLNSVLPNWVRIYVPQGSELVSIEGVEKKEDPYQEYNKTVFSGFFELRPLGVARLVLKYKLPFKVQDKYSVYIQKQPGKDYSLYSFNVDGIESEMYLRTDKQFDFEIKK